MGSRGSGLARGPQIIFLLGAACGCIALVCNPWLLAATLSPDGHFDSDTRNLIVLFEVVMLGVGLALIKWSSPAWSVMRARPNLFLGLFSIFFACSICVAAEGVFFVMNRFKEFHADSIVYAYSGNLHDYDYDLGFVPTAGSHISETMHFNGEQIYEVIYSIDSHNRRVSDVISEERDYDAFALFFGGSFAFGATCEDDEVLTHYFAEETRNVRVYNYAFGGYGTQHLLAKIESGTLRDEVAESDGVLVYVFIPDHVRRAVGSMRIATAYGRYFPHYDVSRSGAVRRRGSFDEGRPVRQWLYDLMSKEQILDYFDADLPLHIGERHLRHSVALIKEAQRQFRVQFGPLPFYVMLFPHTTGERFSNARFRELLGEASVDVLDYTEALDLREPGYFVPHDYHPTAKAHHAVAQLLIEDLRAGLEP